MPDRMRMRAVILAATAAGLLAACAAGPDYQRPEFGMSAAWQPSAQPASSPAAASSPASAVLPVKSTGEAGEHWWELYGDPALNALEQEAFAHNDTVKAAVANVLLARAQLGIVGADRYPTLSANARQTRTKYSSVGAFQYPPGFNTTRNLTHLSLDASYEVDLWGRYSRASESARASLLAAESSRDAAYLSLSTQVAQQYFALLALDQEEAVLKRALDARQEMIALDRKKVEVGAMSDFDLHQAEADEAGIRAQLIALHETRDRQEAAIAVLLGRSPRDIMSGKVALGTPKQSTVWVPEGLPSDLLLRRPDVRAAEMNLVALNAQIGVARAQYYPNISITGYLGQESSAFSQLFTGPARIFQFGAAISQPITDLIFGRIGYQVDAATAQRDAALAQYRLAVANAFADVRNALTEQDDARQILDAQNSRSQALEKAYHQAEARYKVGLSSRLDVLSMENNYLAAELSRIDAQRAQRAAVADLFKAMGGGWRAGDANKPAESGTPEQKPQKEQAPVPAALSKP